MALKELNKRKAPIVTIDKSLDKYDGKVLFPEKLALANKRLEKLGPVKFKTK